MKKKSVKPAPKKPRAKLVSRAAMALQLVNMGKQLENRKNLVEKLKEYIRAGEMQPWEKEMLRHVLDARSTVPSNAERDGRTLRYRGRIQAHLDRIVDLIKSERMHRVDAVGRKIGLYPQNN